MEQPRVILEWRAVESEYSPKSPNWYWTITIISVGSALAALLASNILAALIAVIGGFTVALLGSRRPAQHLFKISTRGIHVSNVLYSYSNIESFAIDDPDGSKLYFKLRVAYVNVITIPLSNVDHEAVRTALKDHSVAEVEHLNSFTATLTDWIGLS